jgi:phenylalanyl-tRNA synthetase beta subunit
VDIKIDVNNLSLNSLIRYKNYLMLGVGAYTDAINERKQTLREVEERGYVENFKLVSGKHGEIQTSTGVIQSQHTNLIKSFITGAIGGTKKNAQNRRKKWTHHKRK